MTGSRQNRGTVLPPRQTPTGLVRGAFRHQRPSALCFLWLTERRMELWPVPPSVVPDRASCCAFSGRISIVRDNDFGFENQDQGAAPGSSTSGTPPSRCWERTAARNGKSI